MGMDGLSMANTGTLKESTSADYASRTEQTMQQDPTNDNKQVQTTSTNPPVKEKGEEEDTPKKKGQQKEEEFEDGLVEEQEEESKDEAEEKEEDSESDIEDLSNPNKDFYVKLDAKHDTIELYDSSNDRLIETISGNELGELVRKLNMASGIFINKKV